MLKKSDLQSLLVDATKKPEIKKNDKKPADRAPPKALPKAEKHKYKLMVGSRTNTFKSLTELSKHANITTKKAKDLLSGEKTDEKIKVTLI